MSNIRVPYAKTTVFWGHFHAQISSYAHCNRVPGSRVARSGQAFNEPKNPPKPAALALVGTNAAVRNVLDLALVKLMSAKNIELLEDHIDRILAEQKLTLAGLVDADTAIQVGKLLKSICSPWWKLGLPTKGPPAP